MAFKVGERAYHQGLGTITGPAVVLEETDVETDVRAAVEGRIRVFLPNGIMIEDCTADEAVDQLINMSTR